MAGWLSVLKVVPWSDVISAAPKVAGGARKLWDAVARKPAAAAGVAPEPADDPLATLAARADQADAALAELRMQLAEATGLIASLADQNTQLIAKVEALRVRLLWLGVATAAAVLAALAALFFPL